MRKLRLAEREALTDVRGAIRGWAFADTAGLRSRIVQADIAANNLTGIAKAAANELIAPLRAELKLKETNT